MKNRLQKSVLITGALILSTVTIAQKKNETSAAVEFKNKYQPALAGGDLETAKKSLVAAKGFIDLAAEHPETKESPKTLWLKGEIYSNFIILGGLAQDTVFVKIVGEDGLKIAVESFKKGFEISDKFDDDIRLSVYEKHGMIDLAATGAYNNNMFKEAAEMYEIEVKFLDAIGEMDTTAIFNASLCYEKSGDYAKAAAGYSKLAKAGYRGAVCYSLASGAYRKNGQIDEAKAIIAEGRKLYPSDREMLLDLVNINIDAGDAAGAEKALNEAIASDPNNKQLYYTIGTIYIDLKENAKAEAALNKALEIDPEYTDAMYQLGAHLISWAMETNNEASNLKMGDPKYNIMLQEADATFRRAIAPLEKYVVKFPNDKDVLTILSQLYRSIGDSAKSEEYKKRADALK